MLTGYAMRQMNDLLPSVQDGQSASSSGLRVLLLERILNLVQFLI
jgi:hypothetical protein